ncbi:MAG TPA: hypothetical protein DCY13_23130 [Verrucomicrobiales bacterium]|nr:hypothetical protein [Verrucomicrobiales bacterium]
MKNGFCLSLLVAVFMLSGCAGYRLGSTGGQRAGIESIEILTPANDTVEARLLAPLTTALRRRVQQDGTFQLATGGPGDVVLSSRITAYQRRELSFQPGDIVTVRDYQLTMTVHATARRRDTGRILMDREVTGRTTIRVADDLVSAERQAMPLLAEDLARNLIGLVAEGDF